MCHQPISIHTSTPQKKHKPSFCKYRFNLFHEIEPQYHKVKSVCSACKLTNTPRKEKHVEGEEKQVEEEEGRNERGESNCKKKLRKLRRRRKDLVVAVEVDGGWDGDVSEDTDADEEE
jgi:hypothetical protein